MLLEPLDRLKKVDLQINLTQGVLEAVGNLTYAVLWDMRIKQSFGLTIFHGIGCRGGAWSLTRNGLGMFRVSSSEAA